MLEELELGIPIASALVAPWVLDGRAAPARSGAVGEVRHEAHPIRLRVRPTLTSLPCPSVSLHFSWKYVRVSSLNDAGIVTGYGRQAFCAASRWTKEFKIEKYKTRAWFGLVALRGRAMYLNWFGMRPPHSPRVQQYRVHDSLQGTRCPLLDSKQHLSLFGGWVDVSDVVAECWRLQCDQVPSTRFKV